MSSCRHASFIRRMMLLWQQKDRSGSRNYNSRQPQSVNLVHTSLLFGPSLPYTHLPTAPYTFCPLPHLLSLSGGQLSLPEYASGDSKNKTLRTLQREGREGGRGGGGGGRDLCTTGECIQTDSQPGTACPPCSVLSRRQSIHILHYTVGPPHGVPLDATQRLVEIHQLGSHWGAGRNGEGEGWGGV